MAITPVHQHTDFADDEPARRARPGRIIGSKGNPAREAEAAGGSRRRPKRRARRASQSQLQDSSS